jgi:Rad3-related DNA helicase
VSSVQELVKERISQRHAGDDKQLEVIFSDHERLLVEAPAGYGKTKTMVSKIAYMLATQVVLTNDEVADLVEKDFCPVKIPVVVYLDSYDFHDIG